MMVEDVSIKELVENMISEFRSEVSVIPLDEQIDNYFHLSNQIIESRKQNKYKKMLESCDNSLPFIEALWNKNSEFASLKWDGSMGLKIMAINCACDYLPVFEDYNTLLIYYEFVNAMPQLAYCKSLFDKAFKMYDIVQGLKRLLLETNGVYQKELKKLLKEPDGKAISRTVHYLENVGKIKRKKVGTTYWITWPNILKKEKFFLKKIINR